MKSQESGGSPSLEAGPWLVGSVIRLLDFVEALPSGKSGELCFGEQGAILVNDRKVCWAVARSMRFGLTDLLQNQFRPPLPRADIECVYRSCREENRPVTQRLLERGLATEASLRRALLKHHGEAILQLASAFATPTRFVETRPGYDARYAFSSAELLALCGASVDPLRRARAQSELDDYLVTETTGAAFVRDQSGSGALLIAVAPSCQLPLAELLELTNRATSLFDIADVFDPGVRLFRVFCCERTALVAWRDKGTCYVGLCSSRAATARLMSALSERLTALPGVSSGPPLQRGAAP